MVLIAYVIEKNVSFEHPKTTKRWFTKIEHTTNGHVVCSPQLFFKNNSPFLTAAKDSMVIKDLTKLICQRLAFCRVSWIPEVNI